MRANFALRPARMRVGRHIPWYVRWSSNAFLMATAGLVVWWALANQHKVTGYNPKEDREQIEKLASDNEALKTRVQELTKHAADQDRLMQIERAAQTELTKNVSQLQEENAALKEDLGFLRKIMSTDSPEGIAISNLKVEPDTKPNEYRYRMLLTQGGQRRGEFKGRVQVVARVIRNGAPVALSFPEDHVAKASGDLDFRYYQKVEGRFAVPEGAVLKTVDVRILAIPGGQVKLSKSVNVT